jgi:hypothetical protein
MRYGNSMLLGGEETGKEILRASIRCRKLGSLRRRINTLPRQTTTKRDCISNDHVVDWRKRDGCRGPGSA